MRVLGFGTYDTAKHPRAGILLEGLRAAGVHVVEVNTPLGISTAERVAILRNPLLMYRLLIAVGKAWLTLIRGMRRLRARRFDLILVGYLGHFDVLLARVLRPRSRIALDMMAFAGDIARDRGVRAGAKSWLLDRLDSLAMRLASVVIVDTDENLTLVPAAIRAKTVVVPIGASAEWYLARRADESGRDEVMRAVFFGTYTPLQGTRVVGEALALLADDEQVFVTMIGTGQDHEETVRIAGTGTNRGWIDWVPAAELPALVAGHDVCLGIFGTTPKARRVVPNKVFEGAAAGCVIVTSDTAPQRRLLGETALFVPPGDSAALAETLRSLATDRQQRRRHRAASAELADAAFTARAIVEPLLQKLSEGHRTATE